MDKYTQHAYAKELLKDMENEKRLFKKLAKAAKVNACYQNQQF